MTAMTRYIRKIPRKKVRSVPAENERKAEAVPFHENQNHKTLFLWIPISFALAYGSISFVLLESNIVSWTLSARLYLLVDCAWLVCISKFAKSRITFLGLLILSGITSYVFFSFLLFCAVPTEWSAINRCQSIFMLSWLASSFAPSVDDAFGRIFWSIVCFVGHIVISFSLVFSIY